jgi:Asp-tRNA(Asn)/Glu-tRNA(Gln) amidotransferase A subunit family amidase
LNIPESLADIQEQVIKREISLIQICQEYINRIKSSSTNAFIEVFEEEALLKAEEIQKKNNK